MTVNEGSSGNAIAYSHSGGETTSDSFKFTVSDGAGGSIAETTFAITVSPNAASQAANIQVTGTAAFGLMLTGSYDYSDAEGNLEGTSSFQWYRADAASGTGQAAIPGASLKSYTPQARRTWANASAWR